MLTASTTSSPSGFDPLAGRLVAWCAGSALLLTIAALSLGRLDPAYPLVFIHAPAAWMSLLLYVLAAVCAGLAVATAAALPSLVLTAIAPTGILFTVLALVTGALCGKPSWGPWWVSDARFTCELVLLAVYLGVLLLRERAAAVLVLVGLLNIPIIYFSVSWWNTVHEQAAVLGASARAFGGMAVMTVAFGMVASAGVLARLRHLMRELHASRATA